MCDLCEEYVVAALPPLRPVWPPLIITDSTTKTARMDPSTVQGNTCVLCICYTYNNLVLTLFIQA